MGLCITLKFEDGTEYDAAITYSTFTDRVMTWRERRRWRFNSTVGRYYGHQLEFLVGRLFREQIINCHNCPRMPIMAIFG